MIEMQLEWTLEAHYTEDTLFSSNWKYHASVTKNTQSFFEANFQNNFSNKKREILWKEKKLQFTETWQNWLQHCTDITHPVCKETKSLFKKPSSIHLYTSMVYISTLKTELHFHKMFFCLLTMEVLPFIAPLNKYLYQRGFFYNCFLSGYELICLNW